MLIKFFSLFILAPFSPMFLFQPIFRKLTKRPKWSFRRSVDITTLFLLISVYMYSLVVFQKSILPYFLLLTIFLGMLVSLYLWKKHEDLRVIRWLYYFWRFHFVTYFFLFWIILFYGLYLYIFVK